MSIPSYSFSCSYSFTKANLLLVTVVDQFTAKATTSKKAIYFLPIMSCSINKLKSHILFTCENVMFSEFT